MMRMVAQRPKSCSDKASRAGPDAAPLKWLNTRLAAHGLHSDRSPSEMIMSSHLRCSVTPSHCHGRAELTTLNKRAR